MANKLIYGNGEISLDLSGNVLGVDIEFSGQADITVSLPSSWVVSSNKQHTRVIGIGMGEQISGTFSIISYTGDVRPTRCVVVTDDLKLDNLEIINPADTLYLNKSKLVFSTSNDKYDELSKDNIYIKKTAKRNIVQKGLLTGPNEYYYISGSHVPEGTEYHIHLDTYQAMTHSTHEKDSVNIYRKLDNGKLYDIKKIKRRRPKKLPKKALKLKAEKIKKNITSISGPQISTDQREGSGTAGGGGATGGYGD